MIWADFLGGPAQGRITIDYESAPTSIAVPIIEPVDWEARRAEPEMPMPRAATYLRVGCSADRVWRYRFVGYR